MDINRKNEEGQDQDLPGYPHYPADEDITNPANGFARVGSDAGDLANSPRLSSLLAKDDTLAEGENEALEDDDDLVIVPGTEADVTEEDLILLGDKDADQDMNDDELVRGNARVDDLEEEDELDIPGEDPDADSDALGQGDEENSYYSLGGDRHESLREDPAGSNDDQ